MGLLLPIDAIVGVCVSCHEKLVLFHLECIGVVILGDIRFWVAWGHIPWPFQPFEVFLLVGVAGAPLRENVGGCDGCLEGGDIVL